MRLGNCGTNRFVGTAKLADLERREQTSADDRFRVFVPSRAKLAETPLSL